MQNHDEFMLSRGAAEFALRSESQVKAAPPIATENVPTVRDWFLSIALKRRPRCPKCGADLLPKVTSIADGIARCRRCSPSPDLDSLIGQANATRAYGAGEFTESHGIWFWTPQRGTPNMPFCERSMNAADELRRRPPPLTDDDVAHALDEPTAGVQSQYSVESVRFPTVEQRRGL